MADRSDSDLIDWKRLFREFEEFEADGETSSIECNAFTQSLLEPIPEFVEFFMKCKVKDDLTREEKVRALYCFLLKKRYEEKLNLLHFAYRIFDDDTGLPDEIISRTPFPHEDGLPRFKYFNKPGYTLGPDLSEA